MTTTPSLPNDIEALKQLLAQREALIAKLLTEIARLKRPAIRTPYACLRTVSDCIAEHPSHRFGEVLQWNLAVNPVAVMPLAA